MTDERLYADLAEWWPLLDAPEEYAPDAAFYGELLTRYADPAPITVLELGSGGGNNALHMKKAFEMVLVDLSERMLGVSRRLNPECEHRTGDMRTVRLDRAFDAVFIHDAISYITSEDDLAATFRTAAVHLRPGGAALFCPDYVRETFREGTDHGGIDRGGRGLRYLEWVTDPDPTDTTYIVDFAYLLREGDEVPRVVHDRHVDGLFARDRWVELIGEAGFEPHVVDYEHEYGPVGSVVFVGVKPG